MSGSDASENLRGPRMEGGSAPLDDEAQRLLEECIDRLNSGEEIDAKGLLAEHPRVAPEVLRLLRVFEGSEEAAIPPAPRSIGDFRLVRQIGRGGMGVVYEAWEASMERRVALKVLPPGSTADDKAFHRFLREAKTAGKIHHPNVVPVYAMGVREETPYYAMEFVEGETLAQLLARLTSTKGEADGKDREGLLETITGLFKASATTLPAATEVTPELNESPTASAPSPLETREVNALYCLRVAEAFAGAAEGLQKAHELGIVHRDLKPSNLILDRGGTLRILDFGLARTEGQQSLTMSGDLIGTVLYMSPEQAMARRIPIDKRTDIYSLGATLYEMLAWRPPFEGKDYQQTLSKIILQEVEPPTRINPRIPRDLETIVLKCLRKDPNDRYGTAEALAQDLRRLVRGDPIEAKPQSAWERLCGRARRHRARIALATAVGGVVLLAGALGIVLWQGEREAQWAEYVQTVNRSLVDLECGIMTAPGQPVEGETVSLGLLYPGDSKGEYIQEYLPGALAALDRAVACFPDRAEAHLARWRVLYALGDIDAASQALGRAVAIDPGWLPAVLYRLEELRQHGKGEEVESALRGLDVRTRSGWERLWLDAHSSALRGEWEKLEGIYSRLIETTAVEPFVGFATDLRLKRSRAALRRGDHQRAVEDFVHLRDESRSLGPALLLASTYYLMGNRDAARRTLDAALTTHASPQGKAALAADAVCDRFGDREKSLEIINAIPEEGYRNVGLQGFYYSAWKLEEAVEAGKRAIALGAGTIRVYYDQIWLFLDLQRPDEALATAEEGVARFPESKRLLNCKGWVHHYRAELDSAIECFQRTLPEARGFQGLGWCYWHLKDLEKSDHFFQEALLRYPRLTPAYYGMSRNCFYRGDLEGAVRNEALCNLLSPGFETDNLLGIYSPPTRSLYAKYWDNLSQAFGREILRGDPRAAVLGLSALSLLHKKDPDPKTASDQAQRAVEKTHAFDGLFLAILAEAQHALGRTAEAIRTLERAIDVPNRRKFAAELLEGYRKEHYPEIASGASVDALLEANGDLESTAKALETSAGDLARYLEAQLFERAGAIDKAVRVLEAVVDHGSREEAVLLRLARLRARAGKREAGLTLIEDEILAHDQESPKAWAQWLTLAAEAPTIPVEKLLVRKPLIEPGKMNGDGSYAADVRWALEEISRRGELRINCGSPSDFVDRKGRTWSHDRFFDGGERAGRYTAAIQNSEDTELYWRLRWWWGGTSIFLAPGYHIPLPCGRYQIALHFARTVIQPPDPKLRAISIFCEGEAILQNYDPAGGAVGVVEMKSFAAEVKDGCLDLILTASHLWGAVISAIELRKIN